MLVDRDAENRIVLTGHIDRNNDHREMLQPGSAVSFQFVGPESYASPDLYPDAHLPGWLYVSVQGDGEICEVLDESQLCTLLIRSTETFGASNQEFTLKNSDPRIAQFLPYVHGFRITVTRISGIAKLAQDKGPVDSRIAMNYLVGQDNTGSTSLFERLLMETAGIE
jgi:transcriptional regulator